MQEGEPAAAGEADGPDAAFRAALHHARPFCKSDLEWHCGEDRQPFPTFMTDFFWSRGRYLEGYTPEGARRFVPGEPLDPLIHVRFPHLVLEGGYACVQTVWRLTRGGSQFIEGNTSSHGNMFDDHIGLEGYEPTISTAEIAAVASRLTVSWVHYDDREDAVSEAVVSEPADASRWDLASCFPEGWPNVIRAPPNSDDDDGGGGGGGGGGCEGGGEGVGEGGRPACHGGDGPYSYESGCEEGGGEEGVCDEGGGPGGSQGLPDGGRPGDMVIYRLFVEEGGLQRGPAALREVVRRVVEKGEEAARRRRAERSA